MTPTVRVQDIVRPHIRRSMANHQTYCKLYRKVMRRVKEASKARATRIEWHCPPFTWDMPPYDPERAVNYIVRKLQHGGFDVTRDGCHIVIDWAAPAREHIKKAVSEKIKDGRAREKKPRDRTVPSSAGPTQQRTAQRTVLMHQAEKLLTSISSKKSKR